MPTIDEIISSAVTQLTTNRTNIRTALQSKYNQTIPSSMTFGDVPTYITNVANYQYSLGLADGESSGGGSYVNENNAQLLNSYVATGGQSQHNGTYTKLENTYHRGFNVYKNNSYDMYLVCVDDNGNRWQVCTDPSETSYQYKEGSGTSFGPVGSYSRNTSLSLSGTVVISAPGSSSSATSSSVSSSSDESSIPSQSSSSDESSVPSQSSSSDESSIPSQSSSSGDGSSVNSFGSSIVSGAKVGFSTTLYVDDYYHNLGITSFATTQINGYSTYNGMPIFKSGNYYLVCEQPQNYNYGYWVLYNDSSLTNQLAHTNESYINEYTPCSEYYGGSYYFRLQTTPVGDSGSYDMC